MFCCNSCNRKFTNRIEYLVHLSRCGNATLSRITDYQISDESEDDPDDPSWCPEKSDWPNRPSSNEDSNFSECDNISSCSSPVTKEQSQIAVYAESVMNLEDSRFCFSDSPQTAPDRCGPSTSTDGKVIEAVPKGEQLLQLGLPIENIRQEPEQLDVQDTSIDQSASICINNTGQQDAPFQNTGCDQDDSTTVKSTENPKDGSTRKKGKKNYCQYCNTFQTKLSRHMVNKHKGLPEVQMYLNTVSSDKKIQIKKRREVSKIILNSFNGKFNEQVLNNEVIGDLIPVRKGKNVSSSTHVVCSICSGLISRKNFCSHKDICKDRQKLMNLIPKVPSSKILVNIDDRFKILREKVLDKMNKDDITLSLIKDPLILEFGRRFLRGHMAEHQRNYVASKMRTLGSLVLKMRDAKPSVEKLEDCIHPSNFDILCQTVSKWSALDETTGICEKGSVPRRLSSNLKMCSQILWTNAIKSTMTVEDQSRIKTNHEKFMSLMCTDWSTEVSCVGDKSLKIKKGASEDKMPLEDDLVSFFNSVKDFVLNATQELRNNCSTELYDKLTKATLAYLIAFNSRRPVEVSYATISNYRNFRSNPESEDSLGVFKVTAFKNDVKVSIIVPGFVKDAIDTLLTCRPTFQIPGELLFGQRDGTAFNGSSVLHSFASKIPMKRPKDFTANGLRHYWATMSQSNSELKKHMPKFLGHTLQTHQKYYELQLDNIQLNVIGPIINEHCHQNSHAGTSSGTSTWSNKIETMTKPTNQTEPLSTPKQKFKDWTDELDSSQSSDDCTSSFPVQKRARWNTPEKRELFDNLPDTVLGKKKPGRGKVKEVWESSKHIKKRHSLQMTRIEVSKYYTKKKTVPTPERKRLQEKPQSQ